MSGCLRIGLLLLLGSGAAAFGAPEFDRVIVLGFDGADAGLVEKYMAAGDLPNLQRLSETGGYRPLGTTNPPQTPVSWSTFATGWNPGRTEILDFLKRQEHSYFPTFAMNEERRQPFLFGPRNPMILGAAAGLTALVLGVTGFGLLGYRRLGWYLLSPLLAVAIGGGGAWAAAEWLPEMRPGAVNHRKGTPVWAVTADHDLPTRVIRVPATFPAEPISGVEMLSGLGVPDMRGRVGTPSYYTSSRDLNADDNEFSVEIIALPAATGTMTSRIVGPANKPFFQYRVDRAGDRGRDAEGRRAARDAERQRLKNEGVPERIDIPVEFSVRPDRSACRIRVGTQEAILRPGEWSDWFVFDFPVNWLLDRAAPLRGIGRFRLQALEPDLAIYLSPINFHPGSQPVPFSHPLDFAPSLADRLGFFKTIGWAIDTWTPNTLASNQRLADEAFFLEDMYATVDAYEKILDRMLDNPDRGLFVQVFMFTDRIGHLFWRFLDTAHPLYDAAEAKRWAGEMRRAYQRMDAIVGRVLDRVDDRTLVLICSDHGFSSFRRSVNYNTWLVRNGFMTLRASAGGVKTLEDLFDQGEFFQNVDWSRTQAYAMGLGPIYLNLAGREPQGTVLPGDEYDRVRQSIIDGLESFVDPETGRRPVHKVYRREEMYRDFDPTLVADLRAANAEGYRVSWQTALGGIPAEILSDNLKPWSGDHCSLDPSVVPGIFFSSAPFAATTPDMEDLYPSILAALGLPVPDDLDGQSVF